MSRRKFSAEFKIESACLVLDQGYNISEACRAVGVGVSEAKDSNEKDNIHVRTAVIIRRKFNSNLQQLK